MSSCSSPLESSQKVRLTVCIIYNEREFFTFLLVTEFLCVCVYKHTANICWRMAVTMVRDHTAFFLHADKWHQTCAHAHILILVLTSNRVIYLSNMFTQVSHTWSTSLHAQATHTCTAAHQTAVASTVVRNKSPLACRRDFHKHDPKSTGAQRCHVTDKMSVSCWAEL